MAAQVRRGWMAACVYVCVCVGGGSEEGGGKRKKVVFFSQLMYVSVCMCVRVCVSVCVCISLSLTFAELAGETRTSDMSKEGGEGGEEGVCE